MYISKYSGHHHASIAIENALHTLSDNIEVSNVNSFHYTNPILEKIINKTYMGVIKRTPEVWGYLYDNPNVVRKTQRLKELIHKHNSQKMKLLLDDFMPDAVICTQAFPCGLVADYKKTYDSDAVLAGALTDYAPHSYWLYDNVDMYFVPSEETKERLVSNGISEDRVKPTGIPIDPKFKKVRDRKKIISSLGLSPAEPIILIMGGSQGFGPILDIVKALNNLRMKFQMIIATGSNKKLCQYLQRKSPRFNKKTAVFGYADNVDELMEASSLIISKPGGITISEALAKRLPMLIVKPIPGHEQMNTRYLVKNKVAIKVNALQDIGVFINELLSNSLALKNMRSRAEKLSKPNSAIDIARATLQRIM
jgi:processive 1,2-diacylglycerol beta-glucosyltransferase